MRRLLDISSQRIIKILELFALREQSLTFKEIAKSVKASVRTVHDDIAFIRERWGDRLVVDVSAKSGVSIKSCSIYTLETICKEIFNESQPLLLFQGVFFYPFKNAVFHESNVFASHSTLARMILKFNGKRHDDTGVRIVKNKEGYYLHAPDEQQFRRLCAWFSLEIRGLERSMFEQWLKDNEIDLSGDYMSQVLRELNPHYDRLLSEHSRIYDAIFFLVSMLREMQGFHAQSFPPEFEEEISDSTLNLVRKKFPAATKNTLKAICAGLKMHHRDIRTCKEWNNIRIHFDEFLTNSLKIIDLPPDESWLEEGYTVLGGAYNLGVFFNMKASTLFNRVEYFASLFKSRNKDVYDYLYRQTELLSAKLGVNLTESFHNILFWLCVRHPDFSGVAIKKRLLVIGDFSERHTGFIADIIEETINGAKTRKVETIPYYLHSGQPLPEPDRYDLVASTVPNIASMLPDLKKTNIIVLNDYPSEENISEIKLAIRSNN